MFKVIGEFFFFIFALIASLLDMASPAKDYSAHSLEDRIAYINENQDKLNEIVDYAFTYTDGSSIDSFFTYDYEKQTGESIFLLKRPLKERITVRHNENDDYVTFDFRTGTKGHSDSGMYYSVNGVYMVPASGTLAEYDAEEDKYLVHQASATVEVIRVNEHWFLYHKDFRKDMKD